MKPPYSKPHLSVPQQLALLESRGMTVADRLRAERYLTRLGYYRLSGYWYPARDTTFIVDGNGSVDRRVDETFRAGTTFERSLDLYVFDKRLRLLFMDALERIEVSLRVEVALLLSARDPFAHRTPAQLHGNFAKKRNHNTGRTRHQDWLARLDDITRRSKEEFVQRFQSKYSSPLPIWIAIELWDFGLLSHFLSGLRHSDVGHLALSYGLPRAELLTSWVRTLNHVRNVSAHHSRLWNRVSTELPKVPRRGEVPDLDHLIPDRQLHNRVYASAAITQHFMKIVSPSSSWGERLKRHIATFPAGPGIDLRHAGFPQGWERLSLWQ
jgi:abortive infection bacteriophage resistance protein